MWTRPLRKLTPETSLGFEAIEFADWVRSRLEELAAAGSEEALALLEVAPRLLEWQRWFLIHALELLPGTDIFRFRTVLLLVARQNGKTTLLIYLILWRMFTDGARMTIGTAQSLDNAGEAWTAVKDIAEAIPELADEIAAGGIKQGKGSQVIKLDGGERYKIASANRRGGRGLSGDLVFMDELREHQTWQAWSAVSKTQMARERAQLYGVSNAGDAASIVLRFLRAAAHLLCGDPDGLNADPLGGALVDEDEPQFDVDEESLGIFEWSAPPGMSIWDRDGWEMANPSMGHVPSMERAIAAAARTDPEWEFRTEVLCQWFAGSLNGPFPPGAWQQGTDDTSKIAKKAKVAVCIDVSWDRSLAHIAFAGFRKDDVVHVEIVASRAGTDWVIPWLESKDRTRKYLAVTVQANGAPASSLVDGLEESSLPFVKWEGQDLARWTGKFYDLVRQVVPEDDNPDAAPGPVGVFHRSQPILDVPANTAVTKPSADAWLWDRSKSPVDASPLVAATGAVGLLLRPDDEVQSAYADPEYDLIVL